MYFRHKTKNPGQGVQALDLGPIRFHIRTGRQCLNFGCLQRLNQILAPKPFACPFPWKPV